ncbi:uncharacterized protein LOC123529380 isoform X2 [Mercenaria mercenaria]|uniref:uncharacterized protein LOC123529380 isoform X2 n=1 Tax=Mercenaria mercenaria TaxID=6596 RepID=UPI00234F3375|nr:uncharacterized protein LOC123529380 isoform X2 [Mercenaria mercenaria]XP_053377296.1 uncharacterized protein LOC123529380 isoform X2 [Mercenaria mercenaria]
MLEETGVCKYVTTLRHLQYRRWDPFDLLGEIVHSCNCYMDQENLPLLSDFRECNIGLQLSSTVNHPGVREEVCTGEPNIEIAEHRSSQRPEKSENTEKMKKPMEEAVMPSGSNLRDGCNKSKYTEVDNFEKDGASLQVVMGRDSHDCEITGMSVNTDSGKEQNISADVIAQIDFEIAKSLKEAFSNIGDFGLNKIVKGPVGSRSRNYPHIADSLSRDKNLHKVKKTKPRRSSADEVNQPNSAKITNVLEQNSARSTVLKKMTELNRLLKEKPVSLSINDKHLQKTNAGCGRKAENHSVKKDLPDIVKEERPSDKDEKQEDDVVWICFVCAKGFADQSELMVHQDVCEEEPSNTDSELLKPAFPTSSNPLASHPSVSTSVTGRFQLDRSNSPPVPTLLRKVGSSLKSLPLGLPNKSREIKRRQRKFEDVYIPPSRNIYFESLGLFPTPSVEAISKSPKKSVNDDDCQIIDLTVDDTPQALPMTPRTRSMLSQLSRDDSNGRRRQLSFSQSSQQSVFDKVPSVEKELSEDSESSNEETVQTQKVPSKSAILGIPLTSPLGQRLKKHWKYENKVPVIENIERYCKTDDASLIDLDKKERKNPMVEKLRNRPPPQCTFRFTKKYLNKWCHWYKFNKGDKWEFKKRLKFGLDRDSRLKLKRMKRCKVVLARISKKDIKYWTTPRPKVVQKRQTETTLLHQLNRQYRLNQVQYALASSMAVRPMQGPIYNQLMQPVRVSGPTPQLLVRTVPMGGQGMRLQVLPIQNTHSQTLFHPTQTSLMPDTPREVARSQKRKQVFNNVKEDDSMVICLSSDEEEEIVIKPLPKQQCAMCRVYKDECKIHGKRRIGPASFMRQQSKNIESAGSVAADVKPNSPGNIIPLQPVKTGLPVQYTNTASAIVFGQPSPQSVTLPIKPVTNSPSLRVNDGTTSMLPPISGKELVNQDSSQTVQIKSETSDIEKSRNESQSTDNEYMDYEVICIDSDENDE